MCRRCHLLSGIGLIDERGIWSERGAIDIVLLGWTTSRTADAAIECSGPYVVGDGKRYWVARPTRTTEIYPRRH
jgi:hypothetical protein